MFVSDYDFIDKEEEKTGIKFSNTNQRILVSTIHATMVEEI